MMEQLALRIALGNVLPATGIAVALPISPSLRHPRMVATLVDPIQEGDVFLLRDKAVPATALAAHDVASLHGIGFRVARLLGRRFMSWYRPGRGLAHRPYCIPADTLAGRDCLPPWPGGTPEFLGGLVPHPFVASKVTVHPALDTSSAVPEGWSHRLAEQISEVVLPGFSVFSREDAERAVGLLLRVGPVRLKPAWARGGDGQCVVQDVESATRFLSGLDSSKLQRHGIVVEQHLQQADTYSVGQVECAGVTASYVGRQRQVRNHAGELVYGGSDLMVLRGDLTDLEDAVQAPALALAIRQARTFDKAVGDAYPGFLASRRNYDLIDGVAANGQRVSGVLEQSWRVGGATPAEIAALATFAADSLCDRVRTSSHEVYGEVSLPAGADVYYRGDAPGGGMLTKYSLVDDGRLRSFV